MILAALSCSNTGLNPSSKVSTLVSHPIDRASSSVATSGHVREVAKSRKSHVAYLNESGSRWCCFTRRTKSGS